MYDKIIYKRYILIHKQFGRRFGLYVKYLISNLRKRKVSVLFMCVSQVLSPYEITNFEIITQSYLWY